MRCGDAVWRCGDDAGAVVMMWRGGILACGQSMAACSGREPVWRKMSSSVHGAFAELIGEVSRRDGGVRESV